MEVKAVAPFRAYLELQMQPRSRHPDWATDLVVAGIIDVLNIEGEEDASPDVCGVVAFPDGFPPVSQPSVSQKEPEPTQGQIFLVVAGDSVANEGGADLVVPAAPFRPAKIAAEGDCLVIFGVGK